MSRIPTRHYVLLNTAGAVGWTLVIGGGGYFFGAALEWLVGEVRRYEGWILGGMAALGLAAWLYHQWRGRREAPTAGARED
jgi:membrane protein DedA with SNARE-associated domain